MKKTNKKKKSALINRIWEGMMIAEMVILAGLGISFLESRNTKDDLRMTEMQTGRLQQEETLYQGSNPRVDLSLSTDLINPDEVQIGEVVKVEALAIPKKAKVNGVEMAITYNPADLKLLGIEYSNQTMRSVPGLGSYEYSRELSDQDGKLKAVFFQNPDSEGKFETTLLMSLSFIRMTNRQIKLSIDRPESMVSVEEKASNALGLTADLEIGALNLTPAQEICQRAGGEWKVNSELIASCVCSNWAGYYQDQNRQWQCSGLCVERPKCLDYPSNPCKVIEPVQGWCQADCSYKQVCELGVCANKLVCPAEKVKKVLGAALTPAPTPVALSWANWESARATFLADSLYFVSSGKEILTLPQDNLTMVPDSDGGNMTNLEAVWADHNRKVMIFFSKDNTNWWATEIRTFNIETVNTWTVYSNSARKLFGAPLGQYYQADKLALYSKNNREVLGELHLSKVKVRAFTELVNACTDYTCPEGGICQVCSNQCVNNNSDANNCGACGNVCGDGQVCSSGQCKALKKIECGDKVCDAVESKVYSESYCREDCSSQQKVCRTHGGIWRDDFASGCKDSCSDTCPAVITPGCDCGSNSCWQEEEDDIRQGFCQGKCVERPDCLDDGENSCDLPEPPYGWCPKDCYYQKLECDENLEACETFLVCT